MMSSSVRSAQDECIEDINKFNVTGAMTSWILYASWNLLGPCHWLKGCAVDESIVQTDHEVRSYLTYVYLTLVSGAVLYLHSLGEDVVYYHVCTTWLVWCTLQEMSE